MKVQWLMCTFRLFNCLKPCVTLCTELKAHNHARDPHSTVHNIIILLLCMGRGAKSRILEVKFLTFAIDEMEFMSWDAC